MRRQANKDKGGKDKDKGNTTVRLPRKHHKHDTPKRFKDSKKKRRRDTNQNHINTIASSNSLQSRDATQ
jgi:hypothetical protein